MNASRKHSAPPPLEKKFGASPGQLKFPGAAIALMH